MSTNPAATLLPILEVATALGLPLEGRRTSCFNGQGHQGGRDDNPSLTFFPDRGRYKCFACGVRGDAIDLVRAIRGVSFPDAVVWLKNLRGSRPYNNHPLTLPRPVSASQYPGPEALEVYAQLYSLAVPPAPGSPEGIYLMEKRGLKLDLAAACGLRTIPPSTVRACFDTERLCAAGLTSKRGDYLFRYHTLLLFYLDGTQPIYVSARDISGQASAKELSPAGLQCPLPYNHGVLLTDNLDTLYVCEGCLDTLSALQLGYPAIGVPGTSGFRSDWFPLLRGIRQIRVLFDNDESGRTQGAELAAQLRLHGIPAERFHPATGKDMNDHLLNTQNTGATL